MKKILIMALLLTGCARLSFDGVEYDRFISINENATQLSASCGKTNIQSDLVLLQKEVNHLNHYEQLRASRKDISLVSNELNSMVNELVARYEKTTPSTTYCIEKLKNITDGSNTILSALGAL
jgi:PBP1b-binding outer membrane lipoprotein LpoB